MAKENQALKLNASMPDERVMKLDKYQAVTVKRKNRMKDFYLFLIDGGIFENHVLNLKTNNQRYVIVLHRIPKYMELKEKYSLISSFIYSSFNLSFLWYFCTLKTIKKF